MSEYQASRVGLFHKALEAKAKAEGVANKVNLADPSLRVALIVEETRELCEAVWNGEPDENILKEVCDVLYVLGGLVYEFGWQSKIDAAFNRVADNNDLKVTLGTFREDGKLIKSKDHPKVDLKDLVA